MPISLFLVCMAPSTVRGLPGGGADRIAAKALRDARSGRYGQAVEGFSEAWNLSKDPAYLYNAAVVSLQKLRRPAKALEWASRYRQAARDGSQRREADGLISHIESRLCSTHGKLRLLVTPSDATTWLDSKEPQARINGPDIWIDPGKHRIFAQAGKPPGASVDVRIRRGFETVVTLKVWGRIAQTSLQEKPFACARPGAVAHLDFAGLEMKSPGGPQALTDVGDRRPDDRDLRDLVASLDGDRSSRVRAQAALSLGNGSGGAAAVNALIEALDDRDPVVRGSAAEALGKIGSVRAFAPLCWAARDRDPFVKKWARISAIRVAGRASIILFDTDGLSAGSGWDSDLWTGAFRKGVREELLSRGGLYADVSSDEGTRGVKVGDRPLVSLNLEGEVVRTKGKGKKATAKVALRVVATPGVVIWEGKAEASGEGGGSSSGTPTVDKAISPFLGGIMGGGKDARKAAIEAAGRKAAASFARAVSLAR